jgi:dienelactone hydrolase
MHPGKLGRRWLLNRLLFAGWADYRGWTSTRIAGLLAEIHRRLGELPYGLKKLGGGSIMLCFLTVLLVFSLAGVGEAKVVTKTVEYQQDGTVFKGYLAYDDAITGKRPGVLVVHEWWGLNDYARKRAEELAQMGYVALAADMYGQGLVTTDREEAGRLAGKLKGDPQLLRRRAQAALQALSANDRVDPRHLAAIGFCFGGTTVLELAYSGADLVGAVSFHGGLPLPQPQEDRNIKASLLVLHGADDPHVPPPDLAAFMEALRRDGVDWQLVIYGGAVHGFSNPAVGRDKGTGVAYDPKAAARSWKQMQAFFQEIFSRKGSGTGSRKI